MSREDQSALYHLRKTLDEQNIMLCFNGPLNRSIIEEIGIALRKHLEGEEVTRSTVGDVFLVYIEQTQNIRNYAASEGKSEREQTLFNSAVVVVRKSEEGYSVNSGNLIRAEHYNALSERIEALQAMDAIELKQHYKTILKAPKEANQTSAGLGLVSMTRVAKKPIGYDYHPVDDQYGFFSLNVTIAGGK